MINTLDTTWHGIRPLILHNGRLADPLDEYVRKIKTITSKGTKKLTDADHETRDRLEWEGGMYFDSENGPFVPGENIERCIQIGAQKSRLGKDVQAVVFCTEDCIRIEYDGPRSLNEMFSDPRFRLVKGVRVQKSRIMRIRPMIPTGWQLSFTLEYDDSIIDPAKIKRAMIDAGQYCGLGDWRPKFGRFKVL